MRVDSQRRLSATAAIIDTVKIGDVLDGEGRHITAKSGMCKCLFHHEGIPSMSYDNEKGVYHCFSCGSGGSVINLIMDCEAKLHRHLMDKDHAIDWALKRYPLSAIKCGFKTIFVTTEIFDESHRDAEGVLTFNFIKPHKPRYRQVLSMPLIARDLRKELAADRTNEEVLNKIAKFVSCCEYSLLEETTLAIVNGAEFGESKRTEPIILTPEMEESFAMLM